MKAKRLVVLISLFILSWSFSAFADEDVPAFSGSFVVEQHDNYPDFSVRELTAQTFESYSDLDELGRAGMAMACIGRESFPQEPGGSLEGLYPSGWQNEWYDNVDQGYVYNRCHLIGSQLTGNDSINNLITGTRYLNTEGMLPYENWVAMYVSNTGNHVLYRVTPLYEGDAPVAYAVQMEGYSVEDFGAGICFHIVIYNVQPGIGIDYSSGETWLDDSVVIDMARSMEAPEEVTREAAGEQEITYILNTNSHKFHYPYCDSVVDMKEKNKAEFYGTREEAIAQGYEPCGRCNP